jgi:hypothetical protein
MRLLRFKIGRWALAGVLLNASGCVIGYGPCLLLQPVKNNLTGRVHFRDFPSSEGMDNVPVLALDRTAYVYAPAQSVHCLPANDVQLVGIAEFPRTSSKIRMSASTASCFRRARAASTRHS